MPGASAVLTHRTAEELQAALLTLSPQREDYATRFVDLLLSCGGQAGLSDIHVQPLPGGICIDWRRDGVLQRVGEFSDGATTSVVARLKVLAGLLTYRDQLPQEGRVIEGPTGWDTRVSTFPTLYGERAAIRFFVNSSQFEQLPELGLPEAIVTTLHNTLRRTSGAVVLCGPAGSGKTTTAYAALRHLAQSSPRRTLFSLEDPVEIPVADVVQTQIHPSGGLDFHTALRSLLRQDPEVILVGEIRDAETAEVFLQASLSGHLVLSTFHAGTTAEAVSRLLDMQLEPYQLRSGLAAVLAQRLVRRLCDCRITIDDPAQLLGLPVSSACAAAGCPKCGQTGYRGRHLIAELLVPEAGPLARAILQHHDTDAIEQAATTAGMIPLWRRAAELVEQAVTSPSEVVRVLGNVPRA